MPPVHRGQTHTCLVGPVRVGECNNVFRSCGCQWRALGVTTACIWFLPLLRRSSLIREEKVAALRDLPMLKDTSLSKREVRVCLRSSLRPVPDSHVSPDSFQAKAGALQCNFQL